MLEKQQENIQELLKLIKDNPNLEILPMVDSECVPCDDYAYWMGKWGSAAIDEYYCSSERVYFKSEDYEELIESAIDAIEDNFSHLSNDEVEELAKHMVNSERWEKAIIVKINNP